MDSMDAKLLLRASEVAVALGVSRAAAYQLMASGALPVVRLGRAVRVPAQALAVWVEQATSPPAASGASGADARAAAKRRGHP
jgi:excisionase family DNA binding protein